MIEDSNKTPDPDMRELSMDEIDETSGAGLISWLKRLFGGNDPQPPRSPFNPPPPPIVK